MTRSIEIDLARPVEFMVPYMGDDATTERAEALVDLARDHVEIFNLWAPHTIGGNWQVNVRLPREKSYVVQCHPDPIVAIGRMLQQLKIDVPVEPGNQLARLELSTALTEWRNAHE